MFITKFRDIFLIIFFVAVYYILFSTKNNTPKQYQYLKGIIYDIETSTESIKYTTKEKVLIEDKKMPTLNIYSELPLPDSFIAKKTESKALADYLLVSEDTIKKMTLFKRTDFVFTVSTTSLQTQIVKKKQIITKPTKIEEEKKDKNLQEDSNILNYHTIKNIIQKSQRTYFYPNTKTSTSGIELQLVSFTPYENKGILKLSLTNNSKQYFFIATTNVTINNDEKISSDFFGQQFLGPQDTIDIYILLHNTSTRKDLIFNLIESGGQNRWLKIKFSLP